jgi:nucleotide-binding universal stress UspA family protein
MFDHILVALDGSGPSKKALETATSLARLTGGTVRVLHVREHGFAGRAGEVEFEGREEAHAIVDTAVAGLTAEGIEASGAVRGSLHGHVAREIVEEATQSGANLIVMSSRGHGELAELVLGSTTHKVLHLGTLPVLVVR